MNESFEVILNNEEFQNYKQLQKDSEATAKVLRELRRDNQNYKLKCDQQQLALRAHQQKIKELSKNSIRLSRRLIAEQDDHFKTQDAFLAREKQLLQKLLVLSNEHENTFASLLNARETKEKLALENASLKCKILEQERLIEGISSECQDSKKQQASLLGKCTIAEAESLASSKQCTELSAKIEQVSLESQRRIVQLEEQLKKVLKEGELQIANIMQGHSEKALRYQQRLNSQNVQIEELQMKVEQKIKENSLLSGQMQAIQYNYNNLLLQHQSIMTKLKRLILKFTALKQQFQTEKENIQVNLWNFKLSLKNDEDAFEQCADQILNKIAQRQRQKQTERTTKSELFALIWRELCSELEVNRQQLRKDQIAEEVAILQIELRQKMTNFKTQMDKSLTDLFNSWLIQ